MRSRSDRGQTLVEFALILPIFILILAGLFDLGRAVFYTSTMSNAAREAVRLAIVDQNVAGIQDRAIEIAGSAITITAGDVDVAFLEPDLSSGTCATSHDLGCTAQVTITYAFQPATPFVGQLTLESHTNQPIEYTFASP